MTGMICLWYGVLAHLPPGWHLCDGTADTPDLRNRFVVGAGDTYAVDEIGGSYFYAHNFTGDGHRHTRAPAPGFMLAGVASFHIDDLQPTTGRTDATFTLPPYKAIYFIMKE